MYTMEVTNEQIDAIIVKEMKVNLETMKTDMEKRRHGHGMAIFEHSVKEDMKKMKKHIKAFELVLKYYGVTEDEL